MGGFLNGYSVWFQSEIVRVTSWSLPQFGEFNVRATKALDIPWCLDSQSHHLFCFDFHQTNLTKNSFSTPNEMMICSSQESSLLYESAVVDCTENIWTEQTKFYLIWWHLAHTSAHIHSLSSISYIHSFTFLLISSYLSTICLKMNGICHNRQQSKNDPIYS